MLDSLDLRSAVVGVSERRFQQVQLFSLKPLTVSQPHWLSMSPSVPVTVTLTASHWLLLALIASRVCSTASTVSHYLSLPPTASTICQVLGIRVEL